jgi:hypothetical protein
MTVSAINSPSDGDMKVIWWIITSYLKYWSFHTTMNKQNKGHEQTKHCYKQEEQWANKTKTNEDTHNHMNKQNITTNKRQYTMMNIMNKIKTRRRMIMIMNNNKTLDDEQEEEW